MKIVVLGAGTAGLVAALMLREKYPFYPIAIVKSGEIGIIGVGEGSTEHWAKFMDFINLSVEEVIYKTRATVKIGILFKDWNLSSEYVHSIDQDPFMKYGRMDLYNHLWLQDAGNKFPITPSFEKIYYKNNIPIRPNFRVSNQYHFDTFKLNEYLLKKCTERKIGIIDTIVEDAVVCSDTGNIIELITKEKNIKADFFIDCSGFKRVLGGKLNNKWISKSEFLPMNHAIAFPTEHDDKEQIEPYTTTTALSSGWAWKIPTQDRYGNGYVFSDNYIDADNALGEISKSLNKNIEKVARDIKFEAGKIDKFWCKNVVSVGLCSSFAEPLEAQSIGFTIVQMFALLDHFDMWRIDNKTSEKYNCAMDEVFDNIIDYLQLHYFVSREDTKFWQDKPFRITSFNNETQPIFKTGNINYTCFKRNPYAMFGSANWYQVMQGLSLIDKKYIFSKSINTKYRDEYYNIINERVQNVINESNNVSVWSHADFIKYVNLSYERKNEN